MFRARARVPYVARLFNPANPDMPNAAGIPALLANERYAEALAHVLFYWGYPAVNVFRRTSAWELMAGAGPGVTLGLFPGAPRNRMGYLDDHLPPSQRKVPGANNDTIYGIGLADLAQEPVVIQTPAQVPPGHYWSVQVLDLFTTVTHQLGSSIATPGAKYLLAGPDWHGAPPNGSTQVLRSPTDTAVVVARSFAARTAEARARARAVLNQIGMLPLSQDRPGRHHFDCEASARNRVFPPGWDAASVASDPERLRIRPVDPRSFWDDLRRALAANPEVAPEDRPLADQARTLLALRDSAPAWYVLMDRVALSADVELHESARYHQAGVDAGNGWQWQENTGAWGTDWLGRAQAAVGHIGVNDHHEAAYFIRGTDEAGELLHGRYAYSLRFARHGLPPVDAARGGFWSLTIYDADFFMRPDSPNGRCNIGTVNLAAHELRFDADGALTVAIGREPPADLVARANWLPAPEGAFALTLRAYVPLPPVPDGAWAPPQVRRTNGL